jgi:hypothetical protein
LPGDTITIGAERISWSGATNVGLFLEASTNGFVCPVDDNSPANPTPCRWRQLSGTFCQLCGFLLFGRSVAFVWGCCGL